MLPIYYFTKNFCLSHTNMTIHPLAIVSPQAQIAADVEIGPFCIIEDDVRIAAGSKLESHVTVKNAVTIGEKNHLHHGVTIGDVPQHTAAKAPFGRIVIGQRNTFRENVTIHRAMKESEVTRVGDDNYLMVNVHLAHDVCIGNSNVLVNNVMLAGHVQVGNNVNVGGGAGIHQFCRIGSFAMVGAKALVLQDVPPFVTVDGLTSRIVGLNQIGLKRNGKSVEEIRALKAVYRLLYRSGLPWREILQKLQADHPTGPGAEMTQFLLGTKRGIVSERRTVREPVLKLHESGSDLSDDSQEDEPRQPLRVCAG